MRVLPFLPTAISSSNRADRARVINTADALAEGTAGMSLRVLVDDSDTASANSRAFAFLKEVESHYHHRKKNEPTVVERGGALSRPVRTLHPVSHLNASEREAVPHAMSNPGNTVGRPVPLYGQMESAILDYTAYRARAYADGRLTPREQERLNRLADRVIQFSLMVCETVGTACALLTGRDGVRSKRFQQRVKEAERASNIIAFPAPESDEEQA